MLNFYCHKLSRKVISTSLEMVEYFDFFYCQKFVYKINIKYHKSNVGFVPTMHANGPGIATVADLRTAHLSTATKANA